MGREVLVIQNRDIYGLNISPLECVKWVDESFRLKALAQLPPKMSVHPQGNDFFTSMPCCLPSSYGVFGMKVVHRILGQPLLLEVKFCCMTVSLDNCKL